MIAWFARNSVAANLLMILILAGGLLALKLDVVLEVFPPADPNTISVSVPLRGATPEDIELGVAVRIEEAIQDLEGIERIFSQSSEGSTRVWVEIDSGYDARDLLNDIKARVDSINTFPAETEKPVVGLAMRRWDVIDVVVSGDHSEQEIRSYAEQIMEDLLRVEGITQVSLKSVRRYEIAIEASQDRLREFNLRLSDLSQAIRQSSLDVSAGNLRTDGGDILLRSKGQAYTGDQFRSIIVKTNPDGSIIRLGDVAVVKDGFEEESLRSRFNGKNAAFIGISRVGDQSAIEIADKVKAYVEERRAGLPVGMELSYWDDESVALKDRLRIMSTSALQGGILVMILLTLFLRPAIAFWVFVGIPITFFGSFILMSIFDISLNMMSAFGFIIVLGIVVDDAIVTGENVYSHLRQGSSGIDAAINGTREVAIPVTFGVLTTIAAFTPIAFIEGRMGDFYAPIPAVVISVMLFSLIESKFVLPAHLKNINLRSGELQQSRFVRWQQNFADSFERAILKYYQPLLRVAVAHRYTTLTIFVGVLVLILALIFSGWTRFVFFPRIESETATASLAMPVGTPFEVTDRYMQQIFSAAQALQNKYRDPQTDQSVIKNIVTQTGWGGPHSGRVEFEVLPRRERTLDVNTSNLVAEWRDLAGPVVGAESMNFRSEFFRAGDPIDVQLRGNSLDTLGRVAELIKDRLATYPGVFEIADSMSDGKEELRIELTRQGQVLGLTRSEILNQVSQAFRGLEAQRIQRGRDDIRVLVRFPADERSTLDTLNDMLITAPDGRLVPLSHVAVLQPGKGPSTITRIDRHRVLNVTADIDKDSTNMTVLQEDLRQYIDQTLLQFPGISYTLEGEARSQRETFGSLQLGFIVVLFVIYCLLALPLKSYVQPLIVMSVIPFGLIGAVIGHWLMGHDLSAMSMLGLMALVGVVVNDSLVLVDFINRRRKWGDALSEAVLSAGVARFRPVMLTSLTTFFGLLPLLLEKSTTAQFLIPMGISLAFGILFATLITLILIPTNVMIVEDLRNLFSRRPAHRNAEPAFSSQQSNS